MRASFQNWSNGVPRVPPNPARFSSRLRKPARGLPLTHPPRTHPQPHPTIGTGRRQQRVADGGRTAQFRLPRRPRAAGAWLRGGSTPAAMPPAGTEALTSRRRDERRRGAAFVSSRALRYRLQAWPVFALVSPSLCSSLVHEHRKEACRRTFQATKLPAADITGNN